MSIREKENDLFKKYTGYPDIVKDGVADEQKYLSSVPKILFILKEPNGGYEDDGTVKFDMRKYMLEGAQSKTWDNITRWTIGIRNVFSNKTYVWCDSIKNIDTDKRKELLSTIAMMNLKKTPGRSSAIKKEVIEFTKNNATVLRQQVRIYAPDIIIFGLGMNHIAHNAGIYLFGEKAWAPINNYEYYVYEYDNKKYAIDCYHPQATKGNQKMYEQLMRTVKSIKDRL